MKITAQETTQAVEENKNLSFISVGTRKDLFFTLFCDEIRKFSFYTKPGKALSALYSKRYITSERK